MIDPFRVCQGGVSSGVFKFTNFDQFWSSFKRGCLGRVSMGGVKGGCPRGVSKLTNFDQSWPIFTNFDQFEKKCWPISTNFDQLQLVKIGQNWFLEGLSHGSKWGIWSKLVKIGQNSFGENWSKLVTMNKQWMGNQILYDAIPL